MKELSRPVKIVDRFTTARDSAVVPAFIENLPALAASDFSALDRHEMFSLAESAWEEVYDPISLRTTLTTATSISSDGERLFIKSVRTYGRILRGAYKFFDARHEPPTALSNLVRAMGQFNDNYYSPDNTTQRKTLLSSMDEYSMEPDFEPASDTSFQTTFRRFLTDIRHRSTHETLLAPEYHDLRKGIRHLLSIVQLAMVLKNDPNKSALYAHMNLLSDDLGTEHDLIFLRAMNGDIDYNTTVVQINPVMQERLLVLTRLFRF